MKTAAFVLGILATISVGWTLIPLAWCIPMLVKLNKAMKGEVQLSTGYKICFLLFVNLIGGIILLCDDN